MLTSLGKFLRKLRIDQGEILKDMADKLGVQSDDRGLQTGEDHNDHHQERFQIRQERRGLRGDGPDAGFGEIRQKKH